VIVLVTGATGFIGRRLCNTLLSSGVEVVPTVRGAPTGDEIAVGDIGPDTDWREALATQPEVVVHLAARVHMVEDKDSSESYRAVNVEGALKCARQAAASGVRRFVFLSSIKVNGESTNGREAFTEDDPTAPGDHYAMYKHEAEKALRQVAAETGMELVVIRPPLVYGPGVKANFDSMMQWLSRGTPLPLAAVSKNRRSLVALDNLVDLIVTCLTHPSAAQQTFLVSDGEDLSTADLLNRLGAALGHPAHLFYLPLALLALGAHAIGKPGIYHRLCGSLQLDITKARKLLGWFPPISVDEGLKRAAEGFLP
jgi:nucleoside-diphosphate-sugar epimerase